MENPASHPDPRHGVFAALQAFVAQLMELLRGGCRREIERRLVGYEIQLVLALHGGGLLSDPDFIASSPDIQLSWRRGLARELAHLRRRRIARHRAQTVRGRGYRRNPPTMIAIRFERRIAARRTRRFGSVRLTFVAATREVLAGAPP